MFAAAVLAAFQENSSLFPPRTYGFFSDFPCQVTLIDCRAPTYHPPMARPTYYHPNRLHTLADHLL